MMSSPLSGWFAHPLRVRYQETDQMGVVFHTNYLNWFEIGRTELIRSAGFDYKSIEQSGMLLPVIDLHCHYALPARYDDTLLICTRISDFTSVRLSFESEIRKVDEASFKPAFYEQQESLPGERLVTGGTKHVWVNKEWRPMRLDKGLPALYDLMRQITS